MGLLRGQERTEVILLLLQTSQWGLIMSSVKTGVQSPSAHYIKVSPIIPILIKQRQGSLEQTSQLG